MDTLVPDKTTSLPCVRNGLTIRAVSANEYVVKRSDRREYFSIGPQEACLLELLDGTNSAEKIRFAFESKFNEPLTEDDLQEFIQAIEPMGLLQDQAGPQSRTGADCGSPWQASEVTIASRVDHDSDSSASTDASRQKKTLKKRLLNGQSWVFFRIPLFNPDALLAGLVRWVPFVWTKGFLFLASLTMVSAFCVMVSSSHLLSAGIPTSPGIVDAVLFLMVMLACTTCHEIAHGATLKHYGGEVPEIGLLFMFFTPCMYCNVSDAWLIPDKWKRLAITAAGGICDLCLWAAAVFVWRVTVIGSSVNYFAFMVLTICGGRSLLNINPLLRLDGYYLLSDWLSIPNLRPRAMDYWMSHMRWMLWGSAKPPSLPDGRKLLIYGLMCWVFAIIFLDLIFLQFFEYMGGQFGITGLLFVCLLIAFGFRRVFKGFFTSELGTMLKTRPGRTSIWAVGLLSIAGMLFLVPVKSTTSGEFEVRPGSVIQLHVPVTGIVQKVFAEDGTMVERGQLLAVLKSPDLEASVIKTEDLLREVEANLARLKAGTRPEEITAQKERVRRSQEWYEAGLAELQQFKAAHDQEMLIQQHRVTEIKAELENAKQELVNSENLYRQGALAGAQLRSEKLQLLQLESRLAQTNAAITAAEAIGVRAREAEVTSRLQSLEQEKDRLLLLEAGSRPEDVAAEEARHERVQHELEFLLTQRGKLELRAPADGMFVAPRLGERLGLVAMQDTLFGTVEQPGSSRVEISVSEDDAAHVKPGQPVTLKARAIPFETFEAVVEGISATATKTDAMGQNFVVVHCQIKDPDGRLKSGMTGFGRILRGWNSIGMILLTKGIRYLRTEFWW